MIRTALAVLLAAALLSISLPAVDAVAEERTAAQMDRAVDRIGAAATELPAEDPGPTADLAPRRVVSVRLPGRSLTTARVEHVTVTGSGEDPARISYALVGRSPTSYRVAAPIATPEGPVALRTPGEHTLVLRFVRQDHEPVVLVSRGDSGRAPQRGSARTPRRHSVDAPTAAPRVQIPARDQASS